MRNVRKPADSRTVALAVSPRTTSWSSKGRRSSSATSSSLSSASPSRASALLMRRRSRAHRGDDEHERREDEHRLGVEGLEQADARQRDREPRERAEQGELGVEAREALGHVGALLARRPPRLVDPLFGGELVRRRHLGHERAPRHEVELGEDEDAERLGEQPQRVQARRHEDAQHDAAGRRRDDDQPPRAPVRVDRRSEERGDDRERRDGQQQVEEDLALGGLRGDREEEGARERDRDEGVAREHRHLDEREPAERRLLVEEVRDRGRRERPQPTTAHRSQRTTG